MVATGTSSAQSGPLEKLKEFRRDMSPTQWLQTKLMFASILFLHIIGFGVFIVFVVPGHYKGLGIGVSCWPTRSGSATPSTPTTSRPSTTPPGS